MKNTRVPRKRACAKASRVFSVLFVASAMFLLAAALAAPAEARGSFSRSSSAASGGFSSGGGQRSGTPAVTGQTRSLGEARYDRQRGELGDNLRDRVDQVRDRVQERNDWHDYPEDDFAYDYDWDSQGDGTTAVDQMVRNASQSSYLTTLPCSGASVVVNDDVYYECDTVWYRRGFLGGTIVYLTSSPPPGYLH